MGSEVGEEKKTPHLQGYLRFKNPVSFQSLKKKLPRARITRCNGSENDNFRYCSKEGNYRTNMENPSFYEEMKLKCISDEYKNVQWRPWQQEVLNLLDGPVDPRTIHWYWEPVGNSGKSYLTKYLALTRDIIICDGKKADIFNQVRMSLEAKKQPKIIILDIPRAYIGNVQYPVIEQLKNGCIYSGKYEGGICVFPRPHVIAFANSRPDIESLSHDRWNIQDIRLERNSGAQHRGVSTTPIPPQAEE